MRAVISVIGKDAVGILASVAAACAAHGANITDVTQSVLREYFVMIMIADVSALNVGFVDFASELDRLGAERGLKITVMREELFSAMHDV
ncbi:MAG: ACT domain-containing protein [Clostridia bacterium]|nr:ACT domain-containing protein [Clostridia bacterium]